MAVIAYLRDRFYMLFDSIVGSVQAESGDWMLAALSGGKKRRAVQHKTGRQTIPETLPDVP